MSNTIAITPFNVLLGTISNNLNRDDVRRLKLQLQGHINKESLDKLKGGIDLIGILRQRGFISERKLAFFRRLLVECGLCVLASLVDEYKQAIQNAGRGMAVKSLNYAGSFQPENVRNLELKWRQHVHSTNKIRLEFSY